MRHFHLGGVNRPGRIWSPSKGGGRVQANLTGLQFLLGFLNLDLGKKPLTRCCKNGCKCVQKEKFLTYVQKLWSKQTDRHVYWQPGSTENITFPCTLLVKSPKVTQIMSFNDMLWYWSRVLHIMSNALFQSDEVACKVVIFTEKGTIKHFSTYQTFNLTWTATELQDPFRSKSEQRNLYF